MTTDLAEFRLVRALRTGQPGAFPTLWNAQAGAVFSVIRAMTATDADAVGWATTFRVELGELSARFTADAPVAAQVGIALYRHLRDAFPGRDAVPAAPVPPTEDGLRRIPETPRLMYLVSLFFDAPTAELERIAGRDEMRAMDDVRRLLEPEADTDARLCVHAALMRAAPVEVLLLPPGMAPEPPKPRWWILGVVGAAALALALAPSVAAWLERPDTAALAARHAAALEEAPLRGGDPVALGIELVRRGVPAVLTEVPDLSTAGLTLLGARIVTGAETAIVLTYAGGTTLWTLQHLAVRPELDGPVVGERRAADGELLQARRVGHAGLVAWREGSTTWVLSSDASTDQLLARAARVHAARRPTPVPFLGAEATTGETIP